jgi:hypothetical protein
MSGVSRVQTALTSTAQSEVPGSLSVDPRDAQLVLHLGILSSFQTRCSLLLTNALPLDHV